MKPTPTNAYMDGHIDATPGYSGGEPHIKNRRIKVRHIVVWRERMGMSPDTIADEYDLGLADVHAALAYYFDHRAAIDRDEEDIRQSLKYAARLTREEVLVLV